MRRQHPPLSWHRRGGVKVAVLVGTLAAGCGGADEALNPEPQDAGLNVLVNGPTEFPHQEEPSLAVDSRGRLFAAWKEMVEPGRVGRVAFSRSDDGGDWTAPIFMERLLAERGQSDPWLLVDESDRLYYAFTNACQIGVTTSADAGESWTPPISLHPDTGETCADKPSLGSDGAGSAYAAFVVADDSGIKIVVSRSEDGGQRWQAPVAISETEVGIHMAPIVVARPGGLVHVVWWSIDQSNILLATSQDFGKGWGGPVRVNPVDGSVPSTEERGGLQVFFPPFPAMALDAGGQLHIAWQDHGTGDWDILAAKSSDGGSSWSEPVRVNDDAVENQWMVTLDVDSRGRVHAAWYDGRTGNTDVRYAVSADQGQTWSANAIMTTVPAPFTRNRLGDYFRLVIGPDDRVHVVWTDARGDDLDIYYASSRGF